MTDRRRDLTRQSQDTSTSHQSTREPQQATARGHNDTPPRNWTPGPREAAPPRNWTPEPQEAAPRRNWTTGPQEAAPRRNWTTGPQEAAPRGERIDAAIDRAVREMMNVDTDRAFRVRVLARLEPPAKRSLGSFWLFAGGAAAAIVVVALVLTRSPHSSLSPVNNQAAERVAAPSIEQSIDRRDFSADSPRQSGRPQRVGRRSVAARNVTQVVPAGVIVATVADESFGLQGGPLDPVLPIAVDSIEPSRIGPSPIAIAPLNPIPQIEIVPLFARLERE